MSFLAPGWIALAAFASLGIAAIHLIAWRLPRTSVLPTARFVPDEPARRAARTLRPADPTLLILRVAILMAGGIAMARPVLQSSPGGVATVIAIERGDYAGGAAILRDSLGGTRVPGLTSFVVFDTAARTFSDEGDAVTEATRAEGPAASLSVGLIAAIREARSLSRDYESVRLVLVSRFASEVFDRATRDVRATWPDSIRVIRVPAAKEAAVRGRLHAVGTTDDAVVAGARLAEANGLVHGESRVLRGIATAADSAWADSGRVLVVWPRAIADTADRVDGIHAAGSTAIGHFIPASSGEAGRVMARWLNGDPAAREMPHAAGCIRTIGFDIPDKGDFALTPSFQRLLAALLGPCGGFRQSGVAADSVLAALAAPPANAPAAVAPGDIGTPDRLAAIIMAAAVLLALIELRVRRKRRAGVAEAQPV